MEDLGHWLFESSIEQEGVYGFIYEITNTFSGKKYIGKKQMFRTIMRSPLKGRKNRRKKLVESDWRVYTGSCAELNEDIELLGKDRFEFRIVSLCGSKWELAYEEAKLQFDMEVLLSTKYYNGIINCRVGKKPKHGTIKDKQV